MVSITLVVDLPLDTDEKSLLAKGVNFVPVTPTTDEFETKEDNEKFFRHLRLKAHFDEDSTEVQGQSESPVGNITSNNPTNPRPDDELTYQLATRIEAMVTSKIDELEKKFQNVEKEMEKLKDDVNESINHVEDLLRQDIDQTWEYAVRNEQYSRKNNLRVLGLEEEEGENLEEKFIKLIGENLQEEVSADEIEIIHRIGAPKNERDRGSRRDTRPRPVIVKLQSHKTKIKIILKRKLLKGKGYVIVEDMADAIAKRLKELKSKRSVESAWFTNGKIKYKQRDDPRVKEIRTWLDLANVE